MTTGEKIDLFFKNPVIEPDGPTQGVLYLLRREVQDCFIGKVVPEDQVIAESQKNRHRLFATVMVIMAGIDLLAKFYAGSDETGTDHFAGLRSTCAPQKQSTASLWSCSLAFQAIFMMQAAENRGGRDAVSRR
jgi:hypothetical protein